MELTELTEWHNTHPALATYAPLMLHLRKPGEIPMAKKRRETFWTPERLKELKRMFPHHSLEFLAQHFERKEDDIARAYNFQKMHKKMKISQTKKNGVTTTVYAAEYAYGAKSPEHYRSDKFYA